MFIDACVGFECPTGSRCKVYEPTGEAYCEPSCDIDNGGCADDEVCSLEDKVCVRSPCPPQVKCTPKTSDGEYRLHIDVVATQSLNLCTGNSF